MSQKITPKAVESKVFKIYGVLVHCHVLDDGRRIIAADSISKLISAMALGIPDMDLELHDLDHFVMWCNTAK